MIFRNHRLNIESEWQNDIDFCGNDCAWRNDGVHDTKRAKKTSVCILLGNG